MKTALITDLTGQDIAAVYAEYAGAAERPHGA